MDNTTSSNSKSEQLLQGGPKMERFVRLNFIYY